MKTTVVFQKSEVGEKKLKVKPHNVAYKGNEKQRQRIWNGFESKKQRESLRRGDPTRWKQLRKKQKFIHPTTASRKIHGRLKHFHLTLWLSFEIRGLVD